MTYVQIINWRNIEPLAYNQCLIWFIKGCIFSYFYSSSLIYFCGFKLISFSFKKKFSSLPSFYFPKLSSKLFDSTFFRLRSFRIKLSKVALNRIKSELLYHLVKVSNLSKWYNKSFENEKLWTYVFQSEAVRSLKFKKLILTFDFLYIIPGVPIVICFYFLFNCPLYVSFSFLFSIILNDMDFLN